MQSINYEEGYKEFNLNGDESRVIRFNPGDPNIMLRAEEAQERINEWKGKIENIELNAEGTAASEEGDARSMLREFNDLIRRELDYIFGADIYDIAFGKQSPLCIVGEKKSFLVEAFLESAMQIIEKETEEFAKTSRARVSKYTKEYHK